MAGWSLIFLLTFFSCSDSSVPQFDEARAWQHLIRQCEFGPRVPGSAGHRQCLGYLTSELQKCGARVSHQTFASTLPLTGETVQLTNIIASFGLDKRERVLLCAHWDTRPRAGLDPDPNRVDQPVPGANDGASGVAVLLEVARHVQNREPAYGIDIILFDGEDAGISGQTETFALGSRHFAATQGRTYRPEFGLLLDMVGDRDLRIYQEEHSLKYAPQLVERVWNRAQRLGLEAFVASPGYQVSDDHLPLLQVGIPCIDIIDFNYEYWHTTQDTPDKCSPGSLAQVGQLVLSLIYEK